MAFVKEALQDADVFLLMVEVGQLRFKDESIIEKLKDAEVPVYVVVNKIDIGDQAKLEETVTHWSHVFLNARQVVPISVTENFNIKELFESIKQEIPEGPEWFPKDQLTDKNDRFITSEVIRERILSNFKQEIPYAVQVEVDAFKEEREIIRIRATIIVARDSQKTIVVGKGGSMIKRVGMEARKALEKYYGKKVFLETFVKVDKDWRDDERKLKRYGY